MIYSFQLCNLVAFYAIMNISNYNVDKLLFYKWYTYNNLWLYKHCVRVNCWVPKNLNIDINRQEHLGVIVGIEILD